ncbi:hypothetical protein [Anaeromyxobacter oryzisoli]|uniref:hypothetical protein n=1 Tax=Anaeromyxobacter oryzisoli TaxID=2925408 RepID=UPI001F562D81|nr:hypothetical protein [Anaeromyxobacter sp. SG63]
MAKLLGMSRIAHAMSPSSASIILVVLGVIEGAAAPMRLAPRAADDCGLRNVALGRPYTLSPAPTYPLTTDAGDSTDLTDGKYVGGGFWTEKGAVGWISARPASITIDLGKPTAIGGAAFSTAAGKADVQWPGGLYLFCSADGKNFGYLGDLVVLDRARGGVPPANGFTRYRFETHALNAQCRFVRIMVDAMGPYVFVDEVEVFGGSAGAAQAPAMSEPDDGTLYWKRHSARRLRSMVGDLLTDARARLATANIQAAARVSAAARLDELARKIAAAGPNEWWTASATYPVNDLHAGVLAVIGSVEQLAGAPALRAWAANPWDPLAMTTEPSVGPAASSAITVAMMDGEVRSAAVDVRNSSGEPLQARIDVSVDEVSPPAWIELRKVAWTGDAEGKPVAAALQPIDPGQGYAISIPAGTTSQLWLNLAPADLATGPHRGMVRLSTRAGAVVSVPLQVEILPGRMPARRRLHVGGWDYLNQNGGTPGSPDYLRQIATTLDAYGVDLPWATASAMAFGRYDAHGRMIEAPDTSTFDEWLTLWPSAARYRVFISACDRLAGLGLGTPAFSEAVKEWAQFWAAHVAGKGIDPGRVDLLFVDEPNGRELAERQIAWARALGASSSGLRSWVDPVYADAARTPAELVGTADVVCVNRGLADRTGAPYRALASVVLAAGKTLEVYGTDGPASGLDPYVYFRLQAWWAFDLGATAVGFWSFTDAGQGSAWREYIAPGAVYSPLFLDGRSVTPSKHLAAIREGVEDYEYLAMLRDAIAAAAARRGADDPALARARAVLASVVHRVLEASRVDAYTWTSPKDRSVADAARIEVVEEVRRLAADRPESP